MINFLVQVLPILDFRTLLLQWKFAGVFDIILPFLLIFALVFAILEKSKVLGQNKGIYAIVALAIAFFAISNPMLTGFFAILFANAGVGFAVLLVVILFIGMFMRDEKGGGWLGVGGLFAVLIFFWVLNRSIIEAGLQPEVFAFFSNNPTLWAAIVYGGGLLAIIAIIYFMMPHDEKTRLDKLLKID